MNDRLSTVKNLQVSGAFVLAVVAGALAAGPLPALGCQYSCGAIGANALLTSSVTSMPP
jgi:hypothetical protein